MPRVRTISQSESLLVGPSPCTGYHWTSGVSNTKVATTGVNTTSLLSELFRVQNINDSYNVGNLQPVSQFGEFAPIDYISISAPTVSLSADYLLTNFVNEAALGFSISTGASNLVGALSGILTETQGDKNYFILTRAEGQDANGNGTALGATEYVKGIGNGFLSSYRVQCSVGALPSVSISIDGSNLKIDGANVASAIPAINPTLGTPILGATYGIPALTTNYSGLATNSDNRAISAIRPGDITLSLGAFNELGALVSDFKLQSFNLDIPLSRTPIEQLGSKFAFARPLQYPINATLSVTALVGDMKTGNLYDLFNQCFPTTYDASINLRNPCGTANVAGYILRGGRFVGQQTTASIGANKSVTYNFQYPFGGPTATGTNIFFSGVYQ